MFRKIRRICFNLSHPVLGEVWQLHHVTDSVNPDPALRDYEISPSKLERMIFEYKRKGYEFVSVDDIFKRRKQKFVAVTLDDGYEDNYSLAWPLFRKHGIPFCVFVATDYVFNDEVRNARGGMSPEQLLEMSSDSLCTIGGHTVSHCRLSAVPAEEQEREMANGKALLESCLGTKVDAFAYPYGEFTPETVSIASRLFRMAFAAWGGVARKGGFNRMVIPRVV